MDDNDGICESLGKLFVEEDQNVYTVNKGAEAIKLIYDRTFDLLLCDVDMPDVNSIDILNSL